MPSPADASSSTIPARPIFPTACCGRWTGRSSLHVNEFLAIQHACHAGVKRVLKTDQTLYMYNASGHGAWEAALANLFSAGDTVLIVETGYFSQSWAEMAVNLGIKVETFAADWRKGADITKLAERLAKDKAHEIKAVLPSTTRPRPAWSCR